MPKLSKVPVVDKQLIKLGHYTLHATGLDVKGDPTFEEHENVGDFIKRSVAASGFWLADFMRYGESRPDWANKISQVSGALGISEKRAKNIRAVGAIEKSRRRDDVEFGLHEVVAGLQPEDQSHWLEEAASHGWDRNELRGRIRASKRLLVIEGRASGMFTVEVTVWVDVTAQNEVKAEETAWDQVKRAIQHLDQPRVIASHVRAEAARKRG